MDGDRVAYDASSWLVATPAPNRVFVWNVRTGKTIRVSGKKTAAADTSSTGAGVFQLALAGSRVAWLMNQGGNLEGDDYLLTSSIAKPQEHQVATAIRQGTSCPGRSAVSCAGKWLGGLAGSGNLITANRWTTDATGSVTAGELDLLNGSKLKRVAAGANTVQAAVADGGRVAALHADGSVALYSVAGKPLLTLDTPSNTVAVALSGMNLVAATKTRQLELYNARTGSLRKTLTAGGGKQPRNLDVQGNIAVYTTGRAGVLHAVDLASGKDRVIAEPHGGVDLAQIDTAGLVYVDNGFERNFGKATLTFLPFATVAGKVG